MQLDAHAVDELDPVREAVAGHRDHDRDIDAQGALDQVGKTLALALLLAEAVDDDDIGALVDLLGDLAGGLQS